MNLLTEEELYKPSFGDKCNNCGSKMICNGCSNCGRCSRHERRTAVMEEKNMHRLQIALTKGRLQDKSVELFEKIVDFAWKKW